MKRSGFSPRKGVAQKTLWAVVVLCYQSMLTAVPTITIVSNSLSPGIPLEGIVLESLDPFRSIETEGLAEIRTAEGWDTVGRPRLFEEDSPAIAPEFTPGMNFSGSRYDLDYITCSATPTTWTSADRRLVLGMPWPEMTPFHNAGVLWSPRRH